MTLHSPEEQHFYCRTLEEALAWCLVWLMAPEIGVGPFSRQRKRLSLPVRGVPEGHRDPWDEPHDSAELRARADATERRQLQRAEVLGVVRQAEVS